jgi:hypothetical protein
MAKITCTEHRQLTTDVNGNIVATFGKGHNTQLGLTAPSGVDAQTAAMGVDTRLARICSDSPLHINWNAPATTSNDYYPAGAEIVVRVAPGDVIHYLLG